MNQAQGEGGLNSKYNSTDHQHKKMPMLKATFMANTSNGFTSNKTRTTNDSKTTNTLANSVDKWQRFPVISNRH
jgi:hypothetical protein